MIEELLEHLLTLTEPGSDGEAQNAVEDADEAKREAVDAEADASAPEPSAASTRQLNATARPEDTPAVGLRAIKYRGYKGLERYDLPLSQMNILTGANNAGKSTALSALRILAMGLGLARRRKPARIHRDGQPRDGWAVPTADLSISLENVHTDLSEEDSAVTFEYANGGELELWFPVDEGCFLLYGENSTKTPRSPKAFRDAFARQVVQVPVLGPLEHNEPLLRVETVKAGAATHRASRHFRNHWYHFPDEFDRFADMLGRTWPGMSVERPELQPQLGSGPVLRMFCREERMTRELYWAGFGFQIWCQLLSHICRAGPTDVLVVDEPETYLHPAVQRQLLGVLRETGAQVIVATHSPSIVMAANDREVVLIDKTKRTAARREKRAAALAAQLGLA